MIRILVFEDNEDFAESLSEIILETDEMELVGLFNTPVNSVKQIQHLQPDIVLMDIDMPLQSGIEALRNIQKEKLDVTILMLTVFDDNERVFQSICDGATGYILKKTPPDKMLEYIREANQGGAPMTPSVARQVLKLFSHPFQNKKDMEMLTAREHDVLTLLVRGHSYKMIAAELKIGLDTVRTHLKSIYVKLHVNSKSEAVAKVLQNRLL